MDEIAIAKIANNNLVPLLLSKGWNLKSMNNIADQTPQSAGHNFGSQRRATTWIDLDNVTGDLMSPHSYQPSSKKIRSSKSVTQSILDFGVGNKLELSKTEDIIKALDEVSKEVSDEFESECQADGIAFEKHTPDSNLLQKADTLDVAQTQQTTPIKKPEKIKKSKTKTTSGLKAKKVNSQRKGKISIGKGPEILDDKGSKTFKSSQTLKPKKLACVEEGLGFQSKISLGYDDDIKGNYGNNYTSLADKLDDILSANSGEGVLESESSGDSQIDGESPDGKITLHPNFEMIKEKLEAAERYDDSDKDNGQRKCRKSIYTHIKPSQITLSDVKTEDFPFGLVNTHETTMAPRKENTFTKRLTMNKKNNKPHSFDKILPSAEGDQDPEELLAFNTETIPSQKNRTCKELTDPQNTLT